MADVLGAPATATLFRRSIKRAATRRDDLGAVAVNRVGFDYSYTLPSSWTVGAPEPVEALRDLARELTPLLAELTGPTILRRLEAHPDLQRCRVLFQERTP